MDCWEDFVREHYGDRIEVESPDGIYRFIWRLSVYGRTIATAETEFELWEEAYHRVCDLLDEELHTNETQGMAA